MKEIVPGLYEQRHLIKPLERATTAASCPVPEWPETTYFTTRDLVSATYDLLARLPPEIDAVAAVPRSGLLPAGVIATHLHIPLWSVAAGRYVPLGTGMRMDTAAGSRPRAEGPPRCIAIIDDTAWSGTAIERAARAVHEAVPAARLVRGVPFAHPQALRHLDYCAATYGGYHFLEWNLFNCGHTPFIATDLDGILCRDQDGLPTSTHAGHPWPPS
jgi:orotate phosphoribosyltransferase